MLTVFLENARIIDPYNSLDIHGAVLVEDGLITAIGGAISPPEGIPRIDISGRWLTPGLIDIHCHLREPGEEYKETIATGSMAAAAGGFTTLCPMPNTDPPNDSAGITRFVIDKAKEAGKVRVFPIAAITKGQNGEELTEFGDLLGAGAVAFSDDGLPVKNARMMRFALEYSLNFGCVIVSHSEEMALSSGGVMNEGKMSTVLGLKGIPNAAEDIMVYRDIRLSELTGARIHIAHVSTKESVRLIRDAKERGVPVTAETAPHYFSLTEDRVDGYNTLAKVNPPLRTEEDRRAVVEGLRDGTIDCIATDHAPHSILEKECEFEHAANGIIGLETALSLGLRLVRNGDLNAYELLSLFTSKASHCLGLGLRGLDRGSRAEFTIIDPEKDFSVEPETLYSRSHNTPFLGKTLKGRVVATVFDGSPVFDLEGLFHAKKDLDRR